ncbi:MAG: alpha/beta hydrolase domain-containing protein, partial [Gammaproteobacteria bacterium]
MRTLVTLFLWCSTLSAEVARVEIQAREEVLGGRAFGLAGPYEKLTGKVYFAVDPANPINKIIADVDKAERNKAGLVEFSSDLYVLKPKLPERGNRAAIYEVSNRGRKGMLAMFNRAAGSLDPTSEAHFGDGFLMRQGYTLIWLGWQWDPPRQPGLIRLYPPVARGIQGLVRSDFVVTERVTSRLLSDREHIPYLVADPEDPQATLTVRDKVESPRRVIPRSQWRFSADRMRVEMPAGFEPHKIYEAVYTAADPVLVGAGPAAVRDFLSFLKYAKTNPIGGIRRAYAFGTSQSGRFLRTFLYYGFNQDESGRQVFDGVMAHVAGGGRGSFNHRFAQPSRDAHPFMNFFYPTDIFPFADLPQTDPETGLTQGLLDRARASKTAPRIFYTNSSYEYWGRAASLIHTALDGKADAPIPENARVYLFAGSQHGPATFPPGRSIGQQRNNPNDFRWAMRALLAAMDRWVTEDAAPPPSLYPRIAEGTLVAPSVVDFPKIPGVGYSTRVHLAYRADYGPNWKSGVVTQEPPKIGKAFPMLVSQVDEDGNESAGLKLPEVAVPLATYTGWN